MTLHKVAKLWINQITVLTMIHTYAHTLQKLIEVIDRIDNMALTNWKETEFRALSWSSTLALFVSLTGLNLAFMLSKVTYNYRSIMQCNALKSHCHLLWY